MTTNNEKTPQNLSYKYPKVKFGLEYNIKIE